MEKEEKQECEKCGCSLVSHEIEIFNTYVEVGGYCDNPDCSRYKLLVP